MARILFFKFLPSFGKGNRNKKTMQENYITFKQNKSNYETLLTSKREWNRKFNNLWSKLIDWFGQVGMSMGLCGEMERSRLQLKPATSPNLVLERYPIVQVATKWGKYFFYGFPSPPPYGWESRFKYLFYNIWNQ